MVEIRTTEYREAGARAIRDPVLQKALEGLQERFGKGTAKAYLELPEGPDLRLRAHEIRMHAVANLDVLLARLVDKIRHSGGQVHFAADAQTAVNRVLDIAHAHDVRLAVKGKSMVSEEIGLNPALEAAGIAVAETDLGEYIVQLANEHPSHIIAPAAHKTRAQVGRLFAEKFLTADMGISGCNLACAETGHITTVSNEGNIRMCASLPRIHVVIMGMERIVGRLTEHDMLFRLLARGAAAQNMATYVSYVGGPRRSDQIDGPEAFHLIILDNGRSRILADAEFREILCCIRCAACLNVCPAYRKVGGHAYGFPYSGPVGAVVTPLMVGIRRAKHLFYGETLCGACRDACPVAIDIPRMLLALRRRVAEGDQQWHVAAIDRREQAFYRAWSWAIRRRYAYDTGLYLAAALQKRLIGTAQASASAGAPIPQFVKGWLDSRDLRPVSRRSFVRRFNRSLEAGEAVPHKWLRKQ